MPATTRVADDLRVALGAAFEGGMTKQEIISLVSTIPSTRVNGGAPQPDQPGPEGKANGHQARDYPIYTQLPPGTIDLPTAARKYDIRLRSIYNWIRRGHLASVGRHQAPARGGGYLVLDETELVDYISQHFRRT